MTYYRRSHLLGLAPRPLNTSVLMWEATEAKARLGGSVERESDWMKDGRAHK